VKVLVNVCYPLDAVHYKLRIATLFRNKFPNFSCYDISKIQMKINQKFIRKDNLRLCVLEVRRETETTLAFGRAKPDPALMYELFFRSPLFKVLSIRMEIDRQFRPQRVDFRSYEFQSGRLLSTR
jgi:hypothetical protein